MYDKHEKCDKFTTPYSVGISIPNFDWSSSKVGLYLFWDVKFPKLEIWKIQRRRLSHDNVDNYQRYNLHHPTDSTERANRNATSILMFRIFCNTHASMHVSPSEYSRAVCASYGC